MRKLIVSVGTVCLAFIFATVPINILRAQISETKIKTMMDDYKGSTVTITGKVLGGKDYKEIKDSTIVISAKTELERTSSIVARTRIFDLGKYSLKVPKDFGDIYIWAIQLKPGQKEATPETPRGVYRDNPIKVGSSDIQGIDITIPKETSLDTIMDTYEGPTVTISGEVFGSRDYKKIVNGGIYILAKTGLEIKSPIVAVTLIFDPGKYSLKVPKDFGDIYISAIQLKPGQKEVTPETLRGVYRDNPIKVGSSDIQGIDITIPKETSLDTIMDTYEGPTVTISGEVFGSRDYKKIVNGGIYILAKTGLEIKSSIVAVTLIFDPGKYSLKVPKDFGDIYIWAVQLKPGQKEATPETLRGVYRDNPIKVGSSDIQGINVTLHEVSEEEASPEFVPVK